MLIFGGLIGSVIFGSDWDWNEVIFWVFVEFLGVKSWLVLTCELPNFSGRLRTKNDASNLN